MTGASPPFAPKPLTAEQKRKVALIEAAIARSHGAVLDDAITLDSFRHSAAQSAYGGIGPDGSLVHYNAEWPARVESLRDEFLRAKGRLDALHTGLRAERLLSAALGELAAAADGWARGLRSTDRTVIQHALDEMRPHWTKAASLAEAGVKSLETGR